ncbi:unnamed protein product [Penicillium olsonii]|nr:unnamed protein product [Penicillium olsonii]CAG7934281.1 unnamed protein product [Penicillium olsonii]
MLWEKAVIGSILGFAATSAARIVGTDEVSLIGPAFLTNFDPSNSTSIRNAKSKFPGLIDNLFESGELNKTDLAFSIDVFSAATNASIYHYSHIGENSKKALTKGKFDDQTIGRIGSVTKLFAVYAIIAKSGIEIFSDPVTKYLPELASNSSGDSLRRIRWDDITVGALASQQAGTGGALDLLTYFRDKKAPVIAPWRNAVYSDGGFAILGQVLARISGKTFTEAIQEILFDPLGMENTSTKVPTGSDVNAMNRSIIDKESAWGADYEILAATGSMYANGADLRTAGLAILNSEILSPATTSEWMKPRSGTGTLVELVGAPWEISRLTIPVTPGSNRTRISDLYIKGGGNVDYTAIFGLSPDHGIGFSILLGGSTATPARWPLRDVVGETFIPAAEFAGVENAKRNLAGVFVDKSLPGTNLTLTVDRGRPGLGVKSLWINGTSGITSQHERLYPAGLSSVSSSLSSLYRTKGAMSIAHRMAAPEVPVKPRAAADGGQGGLFDHSFTWMTIGFAGADDELILNLVDGRLVSVEYPLTGSVFQRAH